MPTKKEATRGLENLESLLLAHKNGSKICWIERGYYDLDLVVGAFRDIQIRQKLDAITKADELLLGFMCYSIMAGESIQKEE